VCHECFF
jgi:cytoplasmic tRNA 2-thiolation protein 1